MRDRDIFESSETVLLVGGIVWAFTALPWLFLAWVVTGIAFPSWDDFTGSPGYFMLFVGTVYGIPIAYLAWSLARVIGRKK